MSVDDVRRTLERLQSKIDSLRLTKLERIEVEELLALLVGVIIQRENALAETKVEEGGAAVAE